MSSRRHPTTMENLPGEVISDIFIRLLAKQVGQMRCVCKAWNALLSDSSFVKSHLHRSTHNNDQILMFFCRGVPFDYSSITSRPSPSLDLQLTNFFKLPVIPQHNRCSEIRVIGSVNGLICFSNEPFNDRSVHIRNPSLSAMLTLPPSSFPSPLFLVGFGFDPKADDYKVVKEGEVYGMRKGSWDLISKKFTWPIRSFGDQNIACVDGLVGRLHWLGSTDSEWVPEPDIIVAFDLGADTYHETPLPNSLLDGHVDCYDVLGVLGGKLCVISCADYGKCEIWVMDEYGVAESWVKSHAFSQFSGEITPYGFTSRNELLFQVNNDDRFHLYDPVAAKTKTFKMMDGMGVSKVVEHVDSLVWVAPDERDRGCSSISQFQV